MFVFIVKDLLITTILVQFKKDIAQKVDSNICKIFNNILRTVLSLKPIEFLLLTPVVIG